MKTAECVTPMHPDKVCDRISDAILDECLRQDPNSRVAIETMGGHGIITITGELTTKAFVDVHKVVKKLCPGYGIQTNIVSQSPEIALGVDTGGAGDQGIMVGFACDDNEDMIPQELYLARSLCRFLFERFPFDGKTQVTINEKRQIETVVASFQNVSQHKLKRTVEAWLELKLEVKDKIKIYANPAGDWSLGGFDADTGVTGRKLMVDNYGPQVAIGGGAFSGKDATKVDRSAAYMARKIAVDLLKQHGAKRVKVKLAYAIGVSEPVMVYARMVKQNGDVEELSEGLKEYNLTPRGIIEFLELRKPQYERTAQWGHFGNKFIWDD